jgi:hypothetical protein
MANILTLEEQTYSLEGEGGTIDCTIDQYIQIAQASAIVASNTLLTAQLAAFKDDLINKMEHTRLSK